MRTCNWAEAADYLNEMYGQGLDKPLASLDSLTRNQPGIIEFRVYRKVLGMNTFARLIDLVAAVHGSHTTTHGTHNYTEFVWKLTPSRAVVCGVRHGKGVYIQLTDTGS